MNKSRWINYNIDMINLLIHELVLFIDKYNTELKLNTDDETFYDNFVSFLYENYILKEKIRLNEYDHNFEYFESMYQTDIIDLFNKFKNISYGFTNNIFYHNNESYSLLEFIFNNIDLINDYNEKYQGELVDNEYYDDEFYDRNNY